MVNAVPAPLSCQPLALLLPLYELAGGDSGIAARSVGRFTAGKNEFEIPVFRFVGPDAEHDPICLGLFAGVHGDEPTGPAALVEFLKRLVSEPERAKGYDLWVYPACNPTGLIDGTRCTRSGKDLNREFWQASSEREVQLLEAELTERAFQGLITLHEDDTADGLYGYAHGRLLNESLLQPALVAAERMLPRDLRGRIDGFAANRGILCDCFRGVLAAPSDQHPQPFDIIFETPGRAPFATQVQAAVLALDSILSEYRGFIAYGGNL